MEPYQTNTNESSPHGQHSRAVTEGEELWIAVEGLRFSSQLTFDEYAKPILGLILLGHANRQAHISANKTGGPKGAIRVPPTALWGHLLSLPETDIGDATNRAMLAIESENDQLAGVLRADYSRIPSSILVSLLRLFSQATEDTDDTFFARVYDDFLDRFARASGKRSGDFSTPREIGTLLMGLLKPQDGMSVYDPCLGSAGFLREALRYVTGTGHPDSHVSLFGQEINEGILAIAKIGLAVNGLLGDADLRLGNTLSEPRHLVRGNLMQFDRVVATPPFGVKLDGVNLEHDPYHRFRYGLPPRGNADFAFIQHMIASLKPEGVMAVVVSHGVLFRGGHERQIRENLLEDDLLEAVIGLPPALFYGTQLSTAVLVINQCKSPERAGKVLFINADSDCERIGDHNVLRPEDVSRITTTFDEYSNSERYSQVVPLDQIRANAFNLHIPRYADSSPLAGLITQYDSFAKYTIGNLAVAINRVNRGGQFEPQPNAIYISITGKHSTDCLGDLQEKHHRYYQVILNERALSPYVAQFLGTDVGQHALSVVTVSTAMQQLTESELKECIIALPTLETQQEIVTTHGKLAALKRAINNFDRELSLNPNSLSEFQKQLDSMLTVIGGLSEADHLRSIIRQGESKTLEFKETFSLDVRKATKERYIEEASLKTVVAFLNSDGGVLLIGVDDGGKINGIDVELNKFHKSVVDKFLLHFKNTLRSRIGEAFYPCVNYRIVEADARKVLFVECKRSDRPCFLDETTFYVRTNPATDKLEGVRQWEYIKTRFPG